MKKHLLLAFVLAFSAGVADAAITKGPYLAYDGANTKMTVLWQLDRTESCTIDWGRDTTYADGTASITESSATTHLFRAVLPNLVPGTKYFYRVNESGGAHTGSFTAAPADNQASAKFLMYADTRSYPARHDQVAQAMLGTFAEGFQTIAFFSGDWTSTNSESSWANEFFPRAYANLLQFQSSVPILGSRGNHEGAATFFRQYFPYPANSYGSFDYGPVHVIVVDQYVSYSAGSAQHTWLVNDLKTTRKEFKIIVLHEPGWSAGGGHPNNTTVQTVLQPLCKQYGVDMIVAAHNHYYARAMVDGVAHVTNAGGGAPFYTPDTTFPNLVVTKPNTLHFVKVSAQGPDMTVQAIGVPSGAVLDTFTFHHATTTPDTTPPAPNPMTFATVPAATGPSSIKMTATTATDSSGVEYFFECMTTGCHSSVWQASATYEDTALQANTAYSYRVKARDLSTAKNETQPSAAASATTLAPDTTPPAVPQGLTATAAAGAIALDWADNTDSDLQSYTVKRSTSAAGPFTTLSIVTASAYSDSTVTAGNTYYYVVSANDKSGNASPDSVVVSATAQLDVNELVSGQPRTLSAPKGDFKFFTIKVPATATKLVVNLAGGTGDADLYVRFGAQPTTATYDCRPYKNGNTESCPIAPPKAGTYHVGVRAYAAYGNTTLTATVTP